MAISFFIHAIPRGQARVRHSSVNGFSRSYKTKEQQADERTLEALMAEYVPEKPFSGPVMLDIRAVLPMPASKSKKWRDAAIAKCVLPVVKPDLDNIAKHVTDCLVRMRFIEDDKQICWMHLSKCYGDEPGYRISLEEYL